MSRGIFCVMVVAGLLFVGGCDTPSNRSSEQAARSGAKQVNHFFRFPTNSEGHTAEQQNIWDRNKVTTDFTKVMWIHLIALDGKIVRRMPVVAKVTSSGKRLEPVEANGMGCGQYGSFVHCPSFNGYETKEFIQADGTFGSSDSYIFWFDPQHRYHQWGTAGGLGYLLTDYPIDLQNPMDEVTGMYNMSKVAHDWQVQQEAELAKKK
jgi:hypothetical protein